MQVEMFNRILNVLDKLGVAQKDIDWAEHCKAPVSAEEFASETIFVICNSGMKNTVARRIYERVMCALHEGRSATTAFGHEGKAMAIDHIWISRSHLFHEYLNAADKVAYCETLPFIGAITKFHLAKNFGVQVAKPDVHLQRLADHENTTAQALCEQLAYETGYRVATVDTLLWRACATGILDSRSGNLTV
jgi:hypothetical protein